MAHAKFLREQLPGLASQMQAIVNKAKKDNRGLTSAEREKFDVIEADYSALEERIKQVESGRSITDKLNGVSNYGLEEFRDTYRTSPRAQRNKTPYERAFSAYLRGGMEGIENDERQLMASRFLGNGGNFQNAMSTTTGSQGGYAVPQDFSDQLEQAKKWFGGIDGVVGRFKTDTGAPFPWPTINDTGNRGRIIGQNQQVTETDLAFSQVTFNAYIGSSDLVLVPLALMQDSYFDLDSLVAELLGTRLGRLYNWKCTVGTGTNEPTGILTAAVAAGLTSVFPTGETNAISYSDLVNLEHAVDPAYRYNPATRWMFHDSQLKLIKKLVDGMGRPLWQPGLSATFREGAAVDLIAARPTILDHPYVINNDMPVPAANANSVLFGDMSTFKVREVAGGVTVLRLVERYADFLQVGFLGFSRFDAGLLNAGTTPVAVGVNSAT